MGEYERRETVSMTTVSGRKEKVSREERENLLKRDCIDHDSIEKPAASYLKFCYLCSIAVRNKREHVYQHHLKVSRSFIC